MSRPFSKLSADMDRLAEGFEKGANKLVVDAAAQAGRYIADGNPIDTGLSSGNWDGAIGAPILDVQKRFYPTSSRLSMNTLATKKKKSGESVFVSNAVPYVRTLNLFGTSSQARAFWVERASKRALRETLKKAKVL